MKDDPQRQGVRSSWKSLSPSRPSFDPDHFGKLSELRKTAASGAREILMVACSDHGTSPDNLSVTRPGQLYIVQNMAAAVPDAKATRALPTLASIEYAVCFMKVKHAIVCGHLNCRLLSQWLKSHSLQSDPEGPSANPSASATPNELVIRQHVVNQLTNLHSHEFIHERLLDGRLKLYGWVVNDQTARIRSFDPTSARFVPI